MASEKGRLIVFEGADKSGKTSIAKYLQHQLGERSIYNKGIGGDNWLGKLYNCHGYKNTWSFLGDLYIQQRNIIRPAIDKKKIVLQDRWVYSVVSYPGREEYPLLEKVAEKRLLQPDLLVLVSCSLEERIERLRCAPADNHEDLILHPEKIKLWEDELWKKYLRFGGDKFYLDTTGKTVEESGKIILAFLDY